MDLIIQNYDGKSDKLIKDLKRIGLIPKDHKPIKEIHVTDISFEQIKKICGIE